MIDKEEVIAFFDRLAPGWDAGLVRNEEIIKQILDNAEISAGKSVLDVACGTGVLVPDYLKRGVSSVTGIDISPAMAEVARKKYPQKNVTILCGDVEETAFNRQFDCVVVYNAFPHFQNGERLIACLAAKLKPGGTLSIAHGMSREKIDAHHHGSAKVVSNGLISADELAEFFTRSGLAVTARISDDRMYQVTGKNKNQQRGK